LVVGVVVVLAGVAVLTGARRARVGGICLTGLRAALNIVFLAGYPFWALMIITLEVLIIGALAVDGRELKPSTGWKERNHAVSTAGRVLDYAVFLLVDPVALLAVQDLLRYLPQP
jgi:hypothetical protein